MSELSDNKQQFDEGFYVYGTFPLVIQSYYDQNNDEILVVAMANPEGGDTTCTTSCPMTVFFIK